MSILSENDSDRDVDGCGMRLIQKTESLMKKSYKYSNRPSSAMSNTLSNQNDQLPGIMPQKTYVFWIIILMVLFMAAVNFTILVIMVNVLRLGESMESVEMITKEDVVKLYGETDFDYVYYENGVIRGFLDIPLQIHSKEGSVHVNMKKYNEIVPSEKMKMTSDEILFSHLDTFEVIDPETEESVFSSEHKHFKIPKGVSHLNVKNLRVNRLVSTKNSNLTLKSDTITRLRGNDGVRIRGKGITFFADGDIYLKSVNGSIHLLAGNITIDVKRVPIAATKNHFGRSPIFQYKLCVCMPQGILFKVPISKNIKSHLACSFVDLSSGNNPCLKW